MQEELSGIPDAGRGGGAGRAWLGGFLLLVVAGVGYLVLGLVYLLGDPCLPFCVASDTGAWGTLSTAVFVGFGLGLLGLFVRLVRRRRFGGVVWSTLGWGVVLTVAASAAMIAADVVTAEPRFCSC